MDEESNLIYMKARFYDPELGQFLSQDAFEGTSDTPPSLHKYLYAYGNPLTFVDPTGNCNVDPLGMECSFVGALWDWATGKVSEAADKVEDYSIEKTQEQGDFVTYGGGPYPTLNPWHLLGYSSEVVKENPDLVLTAPLIANPMLRAKGVSKVVSAEREATEELASMVNREKRITQTGRIVESSRTTATNVVADDSVGASKASQAATDKSFALPAPEIKLSKQRKEHIIMGNQTGGGHAARANLEGVVGPEGPGQFVILPKPDKTYFNPGLSDEEIISGAKRIASDPASYPKGQIPIAKKTTSKFKATGEINGQKTEVVVQPKGEGVISAFPKKEEDL